ncbi:hypothetical protein [Aquabacterium sp.]|uniref:hypothetical protein n=1 Tax=Aquabacterium sp. TaxID=1872578 RepID=UPI00248708A8|nr:hypothetical protein [Aquabacterium sp.]MDI1259939.1 hypothetical protein [Aquabacterium sp.]
MKTVFNNLCKITALTAAFALYGQIAHGADLPTPLHIEKSVEKLTNQLKQLCPLADPASQSAFDQCRQALFTDSLLKQAMVKPVVLWGRRKDAELPLKETHLTEFDPGILTGLYIPLFMFDGKYKITYVEREKLFLATLGVGFRNRLQPGQFPYPFWHDANKWEMYENARSLYLWMDPRTGLIRFAQFSNRGNPAEGHVVNKATLPTFDGKWLWTDAQGKTQPAVTLFDGLYREDNPYKAQLDKSYREFATSLRDSQCLNCHVPNNPEKMKRLVLLQSPAHASGEIHRVLKSVRERKMPLDEQGIEKTLDPAMEKTLLEKGGAFEKFVDAAIEWERTQAPRPIK